MNEKDLKQEGNTLQVTFSVTNKYENIKTSPKYVISGLAELQIQVIVEIGPSNDYQRSSFTFFIFLKFMKVWKYDNLPYMIEFNSNKLAIKKVFITDDGTWHLLHHSGPLLQHEYIFDVTVHLGQVPSASPLASLYEDMELADFKLQGEGSSVHVHKAVFAAYSPVFRKMLAGTWRETKEGVINIPGASATTLENFKNYLYLHTLPDEGLEQLVVLAKTYMMPDLEQLCVDKLMLNMTSENTCDLLEFAAQHGVKRMILIILKQIHVKTIDVDTMYDHFIEQKLI